MQRAKYHILRAILVATGIFAASAVPLRGTPECVYCKKGCTSEKGKFAFDDCAYKSGGGCSVKCYGYCCAAAEHGDDWFDVEDEG